MGKRILIVDDEVEIAESLEMRFKQEGYDVLVAHDGQEGFELAKKEVPDLIILDEMMPKMDGLKVCGLLKADARFKNISIIMFTAKITDEQEGLYQEVGVDACLSKMTDFELLLEKVQGLLNNSNPGN